MGVIFYKRKSIMSLLVLIVLLGLSLRFYNLSNYSLWYDEALSVIQVQDAEQISPKDFTPPLYGLFMKFWMQITDSEFGLRFPSAIFGSISILMIFLVGKALFTDKVGLIGAFLLAISPFQIYYSQEARMYSLITLLTLSSAYLFIRSLKNETNGFWIGFVIITLLNMYTHYIGVFFWIAEIIFISVIFRKLSKKIKKRCFIGNILIFLLSSPWLVLSYNALENIKKSTSTYKYFWAPAVSLKSLFLTLKTFSIGYHAVYLVSLCTVAIFVFFFIQGVMKFKKDKSLILSLLCLILPVGAIFITSKFKSMYVDRYFISSALFYYLIVASGLSGLNNKKLVLSMFCIAFLSTITLVNYYNNILPYSDKEHVWIQRKKDHRGIVRYIGKNYEEGDAVYHTCRNTIYPFIYYANRSKGEIARLKENNVCLAASFQETDRIIFSEVDSYERYHDKPGYYALKDKKNFWLILSSFEFEIVEESPQDRMLLKQIDKYFKIIESKKFKGAKVFFYEKM
ncbi:MAG: glycosyltransferase family 39 protein [Candidatus Saelkia tenebricola]|nr:glycosyltransferase family 39 protein [Candidatus Saelkia tenebricola]